MKKIFSILLVIVLLLGSTLSVNAKPLATIEASDGVYGGYSEVIVSITGSLPNTATQPYVFGQCWNPDYVWAAYFEVGEPVGPLASSLWHGEAANCLATVGYFKRQGFGNWVPLGSDSFEVVPL